MRTNAAFTLTELLMAMAIGLVISNIALASFVATQKYVKRVEALGAQTSAAQSMALWCSTKPGHESAYPTGRQFRQMGGAITTYGNDFALLSVQEEVSGSPVERLKLYVPLSKD